MAVDELPISANQDTLQQLLDRGAEQAMSREYEQSLQQFEEARRLGAVGDDVVYGTVFNLRQLGRTSEAEAALSAGLEQYADSRRLWRERGYLDAAVKQYESSVAAFLRASDLGTTPSDKARDLASALWVLRLDKRYDDAARHIASAFPEVAADPVVVYQRAALALDTGDVEGAISCFTALIEKGDQDAEAFSWLISLLRDRGDYRVALDLVERADFPDQSDLRAAESDLYRSLGWKEHARRAREPGRTGRRRGGLVGRVLAVITQPVRQVVRSVRYRREQEERKRFDERCSVLPLLDTFSTWPAASRRSVRAMVQKYWLREIQLRVSNQRFEAAAWVTAVAVALALLFGGPVIGDLLEWIELSLDRVVLLITGEALGVMAVVVLSVVAVWWVESDKAALMMLTITTGVLLSAGAFAYRNESTGWADPMNEGLATGVILAIVGIWVLIPLAYVVESAVESRLRRVEHALPQAAAVDGLLTMITQLDERQEPVSPDSRRAWVSSLEQVASSLNRTFRRQSNSGDIGTDEWISTRAAGFGAYFRCLKLWVLSPQPETWRNLRNLLWEQLDCIAIGDWGKVGWQEPQELQRTNRRLRILQVLRALIVAAAPAVALILVQRSSLALKPPLADRVQLGVMLWALLYVIYRLDPQAVEKIPVLSGLTQGAAPGAKPDNKGPTTPGQSPGSGL